MSQKLKKFALIGAGGRSGMYVKALTETYSANNRLVAICDSNPVRAKARALTAMENAMKNGVANGDEAMPKCYSPEGFDDMVKDHKPDCIIVTTKDSHHDDYICRSLEAGCDVITEKPMTTDENKCQRIINAQKATGKKVKVTFNYRYAPPRSQLKELLMSGIIGNVLSVDFHWMLNISHGADYFRRWHRQKKNSGGLMVHKATHHFDLINWWLSSVPQQVYATGKRDFYTPETAQRYGFTNRAERCRDCPEKQKCPFCLDLNAKPDLKELYLNAEKHDGYFRDQCVFSSQIEIEDSISLTATYRSGAILTYSLNAFLPWEGFTVAFNGSRGRIEHFCQESSYINGDGTPPGELNLKETSTTVFPHFGPPYKVDLWTGKGGHGGGDKVMLEDIFGEDPPEDKYLRAADQRAGAWSILTGIAANHSMANNKPVLIDSLVSGLALPDYPPMPTKSEKLEIRV